MHEQIRMEGEKELERDGLALLWSAIAAGLSMGASLAAKAFPRRLPDDPNRFSSRTSAIPSGFIIVIMARQRCLPKTPSRRYCQSCISPRRATC
ncbi:hypothetical protein J4732_10250 [Serratia marcescens]|uniref:Uncharacterized protein n=1 Tax=Serratia marcescens TaxID=615 RepID=A0A939NJV3_SERMA|nr:hypothetical protein [Serratia marcescens]